MGRTRTGHSYHLFDQGKPGLAEESARKKAPSTPVPEVSKKMRACWNCGTQYNTAADATTCEKWHESEGAT